MYIDYSADKPHEECGVFGILAASDDVDTASASYFALHALQHRGQESSGIAVSKGEEIEYYKDLGLTIEVFTPERLERLSGGRLAIGHVRYAPHEYASVINAQPLVFNCKRGKIALSHNGALINGVNLRRRILDEGALFQTQVDIELFAHLVARSQKEDFADALFEAQAQVKGAFSMVIMAEGNLYALRDPTGMRPLCIGLIDGKHYCVASESCALDAVGAAFVRDVMPGEIVEISESGLRSHAEHAKDAPRRLCIFEFIYFARPDSRIDGISVYEARYEAGRALARLHPADADIVVGVPDSALAGAMGYARELGVPFADGLSKNRYIGRTFIQPLQTMREQAVRMKLSALSANIAGKSVALVDDSIVRGTTSKHIVEMLRMAGAKQVHMRISSPPVTQPCHFGIDTASTDQLIGANNSVDEICRIIGADTLSYIPLNELLEAASLTRARALCGAPSCGFCSDCFGA